MELVGFDWLESAARFQQIPIFQALSYEETQVLAPIIRTEVAPSGRIIVEQNALGRALYLVAKGRVRVEKLTNPEDSRPEAPAELLGHVGTGEMFGEMSLIDDTLTNARVVADGEVELLVMDRTPFEKLLATHDRLATKVYRAFCKQLTQRLRRADALLAGKPGALGHT